MKVNTRNIRTLTLGGLAFLMLLGVSARPLEACMIPICCIPSGCWECDAGVQSGLAPAGTTTVTFIAPGQAQIAVGTYTTPTMTNTYECSIALSPVDVIERIDGVTLVETATRRPLPNYDWVSNDAAGGAFETTSSELGILGPTSNPWRGFFSVVPGGSVGGVNHVFVFDVTLKKGTTIQKLVSALREQGVLANGSANPDGTLDYGHYHLRRFADGDIQVVFPPARERRQPVTNTGGAGR